jgi:hypothetical protein
MTWFISKPTSAVNSDTPQSGRSMAKSSALSVPLEPDIDH